MKLNFANRAPRWAILIGAMLGIGIACKHTDDTHNLNTPDTASLNAGANTEGNLTLADVETSTNGLSAPKWATSDRFTKRVSGAAPISIQVHLKLRNETQAKAELAAISDPSSSSYRQFLTKDQFVEKYAPTEQDVAAVRAYFEKQGMKIGYIPTNRLFLTVEGTSAQMEKAFSTHLGFYQIGAATKYAPMEAVNLGSELNTRVLAVIGLSTPAVMKPHLIRRDAIASGDAVNKAAVAKCSAFYDRTNTDTQDPSYGSGWSPLIYVPCGYKPSQLRTAYGTDQFITTLPSSIDGSGQTIAIVDAFMPPTLSQDVTTYFTRNDSGHIPANGQIQPVAGPNVMPSTVDTGWYAEATLDVEAVHAMAPGANILYEGAASAYDSSLIAAINDIIANSRATIISNSYGEIEAGESSTNMTAWNQILNTAGLLGIGVYFASGDAGDAAAANNHVPTVNFPASSPFVIAVGGTSLAIDQTGARSWELAWETGISQLKQTYSRGWWSRTLTLSWAPAAPGSYYFGSGGGSSRAFAQPAWQAGIVPVKLSKPSYAKVPVRVLPDVAMLADPFTGFLIGQTGTSGYTEYAIGGTSLATPLFAATMALVQQKLHQDNIVTKAPYSLGFANPLLYKAALNKTLPNSAFMDIAPVISGSKQVLETPSGVAATVDFHGTGNTNQSAIGFDTVTGLGTIQSFTNFYAALAGSYNKP